MKQILIAILSALLLVSAPAVSAPVRAGSVLQDKKAKKVRKTEEVSFRVNMHCKNCVNKITDKISFVKGVEDLDVSLEKKTVTISYNPDKTDAESLAKAIEKCGYKAEKLPR